MSKNLDSHLLKEFLKLAGDQLRGEWLLIGGTLLPAVGIDVRSTVDIDLLGLGTSEAGQTLQLMELAESLGLPVESVNQAAAFFLKKAGYQKSDLIVLHQGASAVIYRPSLELYWKLKMGRLSETDLQDCLRYLEFCTEVNDPVDHQRLSAWIEKAGREQPSAERRNRLKALKSRL